MSATILRKLSKLLTPLGACALLAAALYFEGSAYQTAGAEALETGFRVLGYALSIGLILFIALFVHRFVRLVLLEGLISRTLGEPVPRLLLQLSSLLIFGIATAAIAGYVFKQDLTVLWAASGVAGVVIGMAIREPLLDICSGLALNLDRPIRIGDHVLLHRAGDQTIEGRVEEISWRSTRLRDDFANIVVVPNSRIASSTITNHSRPDSFLEFMITVTLDAAVPTERVLRILEAAVVEASAGFAPPKAPNPYVRVRAITLNGVEYGVYFYPPVEARYRARSLVLQRVLHHLNAAALRPAWPKGERAAGDPATTQWRALDTPLVVRALMATALLTGLPEEDLRALAENAELRRLPAGHTLVQSGEAASALYVVVEGLLSVVQGRARAGQPEAVSDLGPSGMVGTAALFQGVAHTETARSRTDVLLVEIGMDAIQAMLTRRPEAAEPLSRRVAARMMAETRGRKDSRRGPTGEADLAADVLAHLRRTTGVRPFPLASVTAPDSL